MKKKLIIAILGLVFGMNMQAEDKVPTVLELSLTQAQDYAVEQNRSLRNASLAVQQSKMQRWQTIASMLPQVQGTLGYTNMFNYEINFGGTGSNSQMDALY